MFWSLKKISYKVYGKSKEELLREFKGIDKRYKENLMNALKIMIWKKD